MSPKFLLNCSRTLIYGYMRNLNFFDAIDKNDPEICPKLLQKARLRSYENFKFFDASDENDPEIHSTLLYDAYLRSYGKFKFF